MALTLDDFNEIRFDSAFPVEASEYKNPNVHRAVFKLNGNGESFSTKEFEAFREEIKLNIKISGFKGFAFGLVLGNFDVDDEKSKQWVDNRNRRGGACQWVVVIHQEMKTGLGVHMWQRGRTTDIYESILSQLKEKGVSIDNHVKKPEGFMKWVVRLTSLLGMQVYRPKI